MDNISAIRIGETPTPTGAGALTLVAIVTDLEWGQA
jgi:hypothetical protein